MAVDDNLPRENIGPTGSEGGRFAVTGCPPREASLSAPGASSAVSPPLTLWERAGRGATSPGQLTAGAPARCGLAGWGTGREGGSKAVLGRLQEALRVKTFCAAQPGPLLMLTELIAMLMSLRGDRGASPESSRAKASIQANFKVTPEELQSCLCQAGKWHLLETQLRALQWLSVNSECQPWHL